MATLSIKLLGPPALYLDEKPFQIQRRGHRALLFYLAEKGHLVSRAELLTLFWPEEEEARGRQRLREALSKLRSALPDRELLITHQDLVGLDARRAVIDVQEFRQTASQVAATLPSLTANLPLPEAIVQALTAALQLWRSPYFMAGANLPGSHALDDWLTYTSQSLELTRLRFIERLADHAAALGDGEAALGWLHQAAEYDSLNDLLQARILSLLINLGRRSEALAYLSRLKALYQRENLAGLPASIQALAPKIAGERAVTSQEKGPGEMAGDFSAPAVLRVPMVGREQVLSDLKLAYSRKGVAVIWGEAGSGKTRLVQELYRHIQPAPRFLMAPARSLEAGLAYQPLIEMLRHGIAPEEWRSLPLIWAQYLSTLLPELLILRPDIRAIPDLPEGQARSLIFESIHRLLSSVSSMQPVLVLLDNAQWVDEATLAGLAYLAERAFFRNGGLLAITARPEEPNPALASLVDALNPPPTQITLTPLSQEGIAALGRTIFGRVLPAVFIQQLAEQTGGNPLFLLETLRSLLALSSTPETYDQQATLPVAVSIYGLVHLRLRQASLPARQMLQAAAVIGDEFDPAQLEKASQLRPEAVVEALEALEALRFIEAVGAGRECYRFTNRKIREVLLLELSPARKRLLALRLQVTS